jgi:hypothetical protein
MKVHIVSELIAGHIAALMVLEPVTVVNVECLKAPNYELSGHDGGRRPGGEYDSDEHIPQHTCLSSMVLRRFKYSRAEAGYRRRKDERSRKAIGSAFQASKGDPQLFPIEKTTIYVLRYAAIQSSKKLESVPRLGGSGKGLRPEAALPADCSLGRR